MTLTRIIDVLKVRSSSLNRVSTYNIVKVVLLADIQSVINAVFESEKLLIPRASVYHVDISSSTYSHTTVAKNSRTSQFVAGREFCLNLYFKQRKSLKS